MNSKVSRFIKNFSYTITSNLISLFISTLVILVIPKLIGVEDYGYWQLYLFYINYTGFFHFGWIDGIYLKYGGREYARLNKNDMFSQFWMVVILQILIAGFISLWACIQVTDLDKWFILNMTALCCIIHIPKTMLSYILQATNRIKEYAMLTMIDRIIYCLLIIFLLAIGLNNYKLMIVADLVGRACALLYAAYCCKDIVLGKVKSLKVDVKEIWDNINVGSKLMFSNVASMFILGIVRLGIENTWDVTTFGQISLTMSICNMMMIFINAVGIIIFPMLRRMDEEKLPEAYATLRTILVVPMLGILVLYYPISRVLSLWLPQYVDGLTYMALLFPMCVYEGKMALLINTYLKTLRKEKNMLFINIASVCLSIVTTGIIIVWKQNLTLAVLSIVGLLAFRATVAETVLSKILEVEVKKDIILEFIMTIIFIATGWFFDEWIGASVYLGAYLCFLIAKKKDIIHSVKVVKGLMRPQA